MACNSSFIIASSQLAADKKIPLWRFAAEIYTYIIQHDQWKYWIESSSMLQNAFTF